MDPWGLTANESTVVETKFSRLTFEDNFIPTVSDTLPDSQQYLAILGKKFPLDPIQHNLTLQKKNSTT